MPKANTWPCSRYSPFISFSINAVLWTFQLLMKVIKYRTFSNLDQIVIFMLELLAFADHKIKHSRTMGKCNQRHIKRILNGTWLNLQESRTGINVWTSSKWVHGIMKSCNHISRRLWDMIILLSVVYRTEKIKKNFEVGIFQLLKS